MLRDGEPEVLETDDVEEVEHRRIRCRVCDLDVCSEEHLFVVGRDTVGVFVNQHGFAHEILTARTAWNVLSTGPATTEFTWFAGYAWRHLLCGGCHHHLGWSYETTGDGKPASSVGLRTAEVRLA